MKEALVLQAKDLKLRDIVRYHGGLDDGYREGTVIRIDEGYVHIFRPYIHTTDCAIIGNKVIAYIGTETYKVEVDSKVFFDVLDRRDCV